MCSLQISEYEQARQRILHTQSSKDHHHITVVDHRNHRLPILFLVRYNQHWHQIIVHDNKRQQEHSDRVRLDQNHDFVLLSYGDHCVQLHRNLVQSVLHEEKRKCTNFVKALMLLHIYLCAEIPERICAFPNVVI